MAVFVAAADEAESGDQCGLFLFGGYVASVRDWTDWFAPAWEERVLNGPPTLPYFHMAQLHSEGRDKYSLTEVQAEARIDEAVRVVRSMGSLHLVTANLDGDLFREVFGDTKIIKPGPQPGVYPFEPDYLGFLGFATGALEHVAANCADVDKVDFVIEKKSKVTHRIAYFYDNLADALRASGRKALVPLIGDLIPGDKTRVPLQAADLALWHLRRHECETLTRVDERRLWRLTNGRPRNVLTISRDDLIAFGKRSKARNIKSPFRPKKSRPTGGAASGAA